MNVNNEKGSNFPKVFTVEEAAKETRMSIHWWRAQIHQKKMPTVRIGRRVFIQESVIRDLLSNVDEARN